jgi:hypothetical protein
MRLKTYSIVVAIAALSAGSSFAYADSGSTGTLFPSAPFASSVTGAFVDRLNFSQGAPSLIGASLTNVAMTFRSFNYTRKNISANLPTGPFELKFAGTNVTHNQNSYDGNITASSIPMPETFGMLLASLGLMSVIALRRIKANAG